MKKFLMIISLFISVLGLVSFSPDSDMGYKVGDQAIDFKLKNIDGNLVSMSDFSKSKGIILIFTCNHCPFSKLYEDRIISLHNRYVDRGYPVVAVNPNDPSLQPEDSFENMVIRAKEKNFPFSYLVDDTQDIARTYGATRTPHVYLLKKEGNKFKVAYIGAIDDNPKGGNEVNKNYLEDAIENLGKGKKITTSTTKAIGCTIKWKQA
jgi:peroxiredoxin